MQSLNPRQARFVEEYLIDLSATKAAERAGYSAKSAKSLGSRLLGRPAIAAAIREAKERRSGVVEVKQEEVLRELKLITHCEGIGTPDDRGCGGHRADRI
jgi:phage terminase small subunit